MRWLTIVGILSAVLGLFGESQEAPESPDAPPVAHDPIVAVVLGKPVFESDLAPSDADKILWKELSADAIAQKQSELRPYVFSSIVLSPLFQRYIAEHALEATDEEIRVFLDRMRHSEEHTKNDLEESAENLRRQLSRTDIQPDRRAKLEAELAQAESFVAFYAKPRWPNDEERRSLKAKIPVLESQLLALAASSKDRAGIERELAYCKRFADLDDDQAAHEYKIFLHEIERGLAIRKILKWKINQSLYKRYGGRILWQQAGIEPIDALRQWLEEQEQRGDFVIHDAMLRQSFWDYYRRDHRGFIKSNPKGDEFDTPWWTKKVEQKTE